MADSSLWQRLFAQACPLIGVVHLRPLPGSPRWAGDLAAVERAALADALAYLEGGADGLIVENFGDVPFFASAVPPETVAAMARIATAVVAMAQERPVGINVLRNDALAALGIAAASGARFIRVNVLTGATVTDQGLIEGPAAELLRRRRLLGADGRGAGSGGADGIAILADVLVKHGAPLAPLSLQEAVRDTLERGGADAVIVSGSGTGQPTALGDLEQARSAAAQVVPGAPVLVGSGATLETAAALASRCDGLIVGSALKRGGQLASPVDGQRVRALRLQLPGLLPQSPQIEMAP
ncbi:BtpA/SgcQ family protein [Vulcanococcus limneticus]|uniref:BtpA/SgcQ family protein n=1 Tax=Vulcanococcus limneticus TaxID=2170428 RepID=UPI00398C0106